MRPSWPAHLGIERRRLTGQVAGKRIAVIGVTTLTSRAPGSQPVAHWPDPECAQLVSKAVVVAGSERLLAAAGNEIGHSQKKLFLGSGKLSLQELLDNLAETSGPICVLASGDPGFFGIVNALSDRFGREALDIRPSPSSVSLAFARLGLAWDDATVVSAHGRPLVDAVSLAASSRKVAILTSPQSPPETIGRHLASRDHTFTNAAVCSHLGSPSEKVDVTTPKELAFGTWEPLSVVILWGESSPEPRISWQGGFPAGETTRSIIGSPLDTYNFRGSMITKPEVRAVAISKLRLPRNGIVFDIGAGSGSVGIECSSFSPGISVVCVEKDPDSCARIESNAKALGLSARVKVVCSDAQKFLESSGTPDAAFVGGGGMKVLECCVSKFSQETTLAATFTSLERAELAMGLLGNMISIGVSSATPEGFKDNNLIYLAWRS